MGAPVPVRAKDVDIGIPTQQQGMGGPKIVPEGFQHACPFPQNRPWWSSPCGLRPAQATSPHRFRAKMDHQAPCPVVRPRANERRPFHHGHRPVSNRARCGAKLVRAVNWVHARAMLGQSRIAERESASSEAAFGPERVRKSASVCPTTPTHPTSGGSRRRPRFSWLIHVRHAGDAAHASFPRAKGRTPPAHMPGDTNLRSRGQALKRKQRVVQHARPDRENSDIAMLAIAGHHARPGQCRPHVPHGCRASGGPIADPCNAAVFSSAANPLILGHRGIDRQTRALVQQTLFGRQESRIDQGVGVRVHAGARLDGVASRRLATSVGPLPGLALDTDRRGQDRCESPSVRGPAPRRHGHRSPAGPCGTAWRRDERRSGIRAQAVPAKRLRRATSAVTAIDDRWPSAPVTLRSTVLEPTGSAATKALARALIGRVSGVSSCMIGPDP